MTIKPFGSKLIVLPIERENFKTKSNIEIVQTELKEGEVKAVSAEYNGILKKGSRVLFPKGAGIGEFYNNEECVWIDARPVNEGGDVWAIIEK
jgi:co-chaperonin GroES (HSP10)